MDPGTDEDAGWEKSGDDIYDVRAFQKPMLTVYLEYMHAFVALVVAVVMRIVMYAIIL